MSSECGSLHTQPKARVRAIRFGVRSKFLLGVMLLLVPIFGLVLWSIREDYERQRESTLTGLLQTAEAIAVLVDSSFDQALVLGKAVASDPAVRSLDPARFGPRLQELRPLYPYFINVAVVDARGLTLGWWAADPFPSASPPSVSDRAYF